MTTAITTGIKVVDYLHRLRVKPGGWWITTVGALSFALILWVTPKLARLFDTVAKLDERTGRMELSVSRIESALIQRGVMADRRPLTDDDHDARARVAEVRSFRLLDDASADDGVVGPGIPRRVPAGAAEAAAADRVR